MPSVEKMKAYHDKWSHDDLMKARGEGIVIDQGEAWRYEFSHQDALGHYDLWYRPEDPLAPIDDKRSLRDWFAGQALSGYFAAPNTPHQNATDCAAYMYEMADAMIAARSSTE